MTPNRHSNRSVIASLPLAGRSSRPAQVSAEDLELDARVRRIHDIYGSDLTEFFEVIRRDRRERQAAMASRAGSGI